MAYSRGPRAGAPHSEGTHSAVATNNFSPIKVRVCFLWGSVISIRRRQYSYSKVDIVERLHYCFCRKGAVHIFLVIFFANPNEPSELLHKLNRHTAPQDHFPEFGSFFTAPSRLIKQRLKKEIIAAPISCFFEYPTGRSIYKTGRLLYLPDRYGKIIETATFSLHSRKTKTFYA